MCGSTDPSIILSHPHCAIATWSLLQKKRSCISLLQNSHPFLFALIKWLQYNPKINLIHQRTRTLFQTTKEPCFRGSTIIRGPRTTSFKQGCKPSSSKAVNSKTWKPSRCRHVAFIFHGRYLASVSWECCTHSKRTENLMLRSIFQNIKNGALTAGLLPT